MVGCSAMVPGEHTVEARPEKLETPAGGSRQASRPSAGCGERKIERTPDPRNPELFGKAGDGIEDWRREMRMFVGIEVREPQARIQNALCLRV